MATLPFFKLAAQGWYQQNSFANLKPCAQENARRQFPNNKQGRPRAILPPVTAAYVANLLPMHRGRQRSTISALLSRPCYVKQQSHQAGEKHGGGGSVGFDGA